MDVEIKKIMNSGSYEEWSKQTGLHGEKAVDFLAKKLHQILRGSNHTRVCGSGGSLPATHDKSGGAID